MPLGPLGELQGSHLHHAIPLGSVGDVDTLIDGKAGDLAQVVVHVGADGADPVGAETEALGVAAVNLKEALFAFHAHSQSLLNKSLVYTFSSTSSNTVSYRLAMMQPHIFLNFLRSLTTLLPKKVLPFSKVGS